jgi:hypothetical protein
MNMTFLFCSKTRKREQGLKRTLPRVVALISVVSFGWSRPACFAQNTTGEQPVLKPQTAMLANPQPPQTPGQTPEGADAAIKHFQPGQEPVVVPPVTFVDVNSGRFGKLEVDLTDGQFLDTGVDRLHMVAKDLDVREGVLKSLDIAVHGGHLHDFVFDQLNLTTDGQLNFDSGVFLNHRILQFTQPAQAQVSALISQESLNTFLASPKTLSRLSVSAGKSANAIASLVGLNNGFVGLNVTHANLTLQKSNKVAVDVDSNVGVGQVGLPINGQVEGKLALQDGKLDVQDMHITTAGQELPPEMSKVLLNKINSIASSAQKSNDIQFQFTDLKVVSGKNIQLKGTAVISRLRFGV